MTIHEIKKLSNSLTECQKMILDACVLSVHTISTTTLYEKVEKLTSTSYPNKTINEERMGIPPSLIKNTKWSIEATFDAIIALYSDSYKSYPPVVHESLNERCSYTSFWNQDRDFLSSLLKYSSDNSLSMLSYQMSAKEASKEMVIGIANKMVEYEQMLNVLPYISSDVIKECLRRLIAQHNTSFEQLEQKLLRIAAQSKVKEVEEAANEVKALTYLEEGQLHQALEFMQEHSQFANSSLSQAVQHYSSNSLQSIASLEKQCKKWFAKKNGTFAQEPLLVKLLFALSVLQNSAESAAIIKMMDASFENSTQPINEELRCLVYKVTNNTDAIASSIAQLSSTSYSELSEMDTVGVCLSALFLECSLPYEAVAPIITTVESFQKAKRHTLAQELLYIASTIFPSNEDLHHRLDEQRSMLEFEPLSALLTHKQDWEYTLEQLLAASPSNETKQPTTSSRIIYLVNFKTRQITPMLQKANKSGEWSKGRNIALKRLKDEAIEGMTPQDRSIGKTITQYATFRSIENYDFGDKVWRELVGHPYLFDSIAPDISVELVERKPILVVVKKGTGYSLEFDIKPIPNASYQLVKETNTRYAYIDQNTFYREIGGKIGDGKLQIPAAGEGMLKQLIARLSGIIEVHSDFSNQYAEQRPADTTLHVLILPVGDSLKAEILVKPATSKPPYCRPGRGIEYINTTDEQGLNIQLIRNMDEEKQKADELLSEISKLEFNQDDDQSMLFTDPSECLSLLEVLQEQPDCIVEWPEGAKYRLSRKVGMAGFSIEVSQKGQWFEVEGNIRVDETTVFTLQELLKMRRATNRRFIEMGEGEFIALTEALRRRLDEIESSFADSKSNKVSSFALPSIIDNADEYGSFKASRKVLEMKERIEAANRRSIELPKMLDAELRPYQEEGFRWMARLSEWGAGACLADDMGLGKTVQSIALLLHHASKGASLVVCPASVLPNWESELRRFAPSLTPVILNSTNREDTIKGALPFDVVITTYGLLQSEDTLFKSIEWNCIVFDEAHILKNHQTKTHQAANDLQSKCRIALTGTPLQNHLGELWSIFNLLNPGLLGNLSTFNSRFAIPISQNSETHQRGILKRRISPFLLRRTKSNVLDELPDKTEVTLTIPLSNDEMTFYEALRREAIDNINSTQEAGQKHIQALAELTRLRLACCNTKLVASEMALPSSKMEAFASLADELIKNNHRALVFSQFTKHLSLVQAKLNDMSIPYMYLDGSTPMQERGELVKSFQQGDAPLFLISLKAGGLGLNLTAADYVIHLDPWWNPAIEDQATDRAHRIGQQRPVTVYRLVAEGTIEEKIVRLHKTKRALAEGLLEGADSSAKLSVEEMLQLLM